MNFKDIKIIISEVDGIVTEDLVGMGEMGIPMFKQFYKKDFEAINLIKKNWGFVFVSSDASINMSLCKKKNIPFFHAEKSKKDVYAKILHKHSITADNVLYVGNSYSDIECMRMSGFSACPEDATNLVKNTADYVIPVYSGGGVLCHIYELLLGNKLADREE